MPVLRSKRIVRHAAAQMFDLVADVEAYPKFLPLCKSVKIRSRREDGVRNVLIAVMEAGVAQVRERFTTEAVLDPQALAIDVRYIDGPFRHLMNRWRFADMTTDAAPKTEVDFFIEYEFKSRTLGFMMGSMFDAAFKSFSAAFEARADEIYRGSPHLITAQSKKI